MIARCSPIISCRSTTLADVYCIDDGLSLRELFRAEWFEPMCSKVCKTSESVELVTSCAASPRFRDVCASSYVAHASEWAEQQFYAMSFRISPEGSFVAFLGTDNTVVGWKEVFASNAVTDLSVWT